MGDLIWLSSKILPIKAINDEKKKLAKCLAEEEFKEVEFSRMMNAPIECTDDSIFSGTQNLGKDE